MSTHQAYNAHAPLPAGRADSRAIVGGVGYDLPDYASQSVGSSFAPGSSGNQNVERVRIRTILDIVYENWVPFTSWLMSRFIGPQTPRNAWESPVSFYGAGESITRFGSFPSAQRPFPYPYMVGAVSGFMPMLDQYSMQWAWARNPSGPGVLTPVPIPWDAQYPQLPKVTG